MNLEKVKVIVVNSINEDRIENSTDIEDEELVKFIHDLTELQKSKILLVNKIIDVIVSNLPDALSLLTIKQGIIFNKLVLQQESLSSVAKALLIDRKTCRDHKLAGINKLKKFYPNNEELLNLLSNL